MSHKPVTIYALAASDEPRKWRYVGMSTNLELRAKVHSEGKGVWSRGYQGWVREVFARGATIQLTVLEAQIPNKHGLTAENEWINKLRREGCALVNALSPYEKWKAACLAQRRAHILRGLK